MNVARLAYWDTLIVAAARRFGARYLLSEDFQSNAQYGELRVLKPFDHEVSEFISQ